MAPNYRSHFFETFFLKGTKLMERILLLGSKSISRQRLLQEAQIPFKVIGHSLDESACEVDNLTPQQIVEKIALEKMKHVNLPEGQGGDICFVLTADTLCTTKDGQVQGKPVDRYDAIEKIKASRGGARVGSAFVLDKRAYRFDEWHVVERIQKFVHTDYVFEVPDEWIDIYLEKSVGLRASGAIAIEGFGEQFLKSVSGSYSAIVGLPMFELREVLSSLDFFE